MPSSHENNPKKFIDVIDKATRENLIRLEQKIKGLQAEIKAKLETLERYGEEDPDRKEQLALFESTLGLALEGLSGLMDTEIKPGVPPEEFIETNRDRLNEFASQVAETLNYVTKGVNEV